MKNITFNNFASLFYRPVFKATYKLFLGVFILTVLLTPSSPAFALVTPTLSVVGTGDGNSVRLDVNGDANASVVLYYIKTGVGQQITPVGTTNSNGTFSVVISSSQYSIASNTAVHITTGGINGPSSATAIWPAVASLLTAQVSLSQAGIVLPVGQTSSIIATNNTTGILYVSNNSNPSVANINLNGNQITITANTRGSTVVTVCATGYTTSCPSIYVTAQNTGAPALVFSQSNVTLALGQSFPVTISGGNGIYMVLNNSNSTLVSSMINGSSITMTASSMNGTASITVCSTDMSSCGIINVTTGSAYSSTVTFSQSNPTIYTGQSITVGVYGGANNAYYISSNSNPSVAQASLLANTITITGLVNGLTVLNVCSSSGGCAQLPITVSYISSGGTITLGQSSLNLSVNQTLSIVISGGVAPYNLPIPSSNIYQASVSGNILTVTGISAGSSSLTVCSGGGGCTSLYLTVNGSSNTTPQQLTFSQNNLSLVAGQNTTITIYGTGQYYISSNTNINVATMTINGNSGLVSGLTSGSTNINICQTGGQCGVLYVTVTGLAQAINTVSGTSFLSSSKSSLVMSQWQNTTINISGGTGSNYTVAYNSSPSTVSTILNGNTLTLSSLKNGNVVIVVCDFSNNCVPISVTVGASSIAIPVITTTPTPFRFTQYLRRGLSGGEISELQRRLTNEGVYNGPFNGSFGPLTEAAVTRYQGLHQIEQLGVVGPETRAALNSR